MKSTIKFLRLAFSSLLIVGLTGTIILTTVSAQPNQNSGSSSNTCSPAFIKKAQHMIDEYQKNTGTPGVSVAIYDNGKTCILVSGTLGDNQKSPVTGETEFAMGSVEKTFSATMLALALVDGKADIDKPAAKYLVGEGGDKVKESSNFWKVTLKDLVTHTAALPSKIPGSKRQVGNNFFNDHPVMASTIQYLNNWHPEYKPGTKYSYSNLGFVLTGSIASTLLNKAYTKILEKDITTPLGMTHTGLLCNPLGAGCAVGYNEEGKPSKEKAIGLWTTADDMLRYVEANLGALKSNDRLGKALNKTHKEFFRVDSTHAVGMAWEEWNKDESLTISKDGIDSGFGSWIGFQPAKDCGVVVLRNGGKKPEPGKLGTKLLKLINSMN